MCAVPVEGLRKKDLSDRVLTQIQRGMRGSLQSMRSMVRPSRHLNGSGSGSRGSSGGRGAAAAAALQLRTAPRLKIFGRFSRF